jgi:hypothetical protein
MLTLGIGLAIIIGLMAIGSISVGGGLHTSSIPALRSSTRAADIVLSEATPQKRSYRYSVIPGGARTQQELVNAIAQDGVVAAHYRSVSIGAVRAETVKRDRLVYVSYRRNNKIFWTKQQVRLSQGETILTDGVTQIRGRCGNCISVQPMTPTADDEPETAQFDALTATDPEEVASAMENGGVGGGTIALRNILPELGLRSFGAPGNGQSVNGGLF